MSRLCMVIVLLQAAAATCRLPAAGAQEAPEPSATWAIAGRVVLCLRATIGDYTPARRVEFLDVRLNEILSKADQPIRGEDIILRQDNGAVVITVNGDLLVTVSKQDAEANKTTREKLGAVWVGNLRKTVPLLSPRENRKGA